MPENPGVPPLFRGIFNNAYLPYRDPETLRAFLKVIDEFEYDHSERLGDAFEYLLSVMGAQGDAGQFRTPRHIIDFIVAVIDPKKHETVLDPACGTAGFLISSYKHILAANRDEHGQSTLTPDDRGRLADNFMGYDISPDMVRLSLVNLYLHGFADPRIHEYDTLTSEERWSQHADVILANPPFMSPKGGIRPHNHFSVQSKRSEVLFVDYMAEHLTPAGRAGIIVPEGIIFQSQKAHTRLRHMLVEDSLVAVVSLPAGVFKPYSGVKTSILILDRALARRTDHIAFFKVENDGFDLGDQRRPIAKNDLPQVQAELTEYLRRVRVGESLDGFEPGLGLVVEKQRIAADDGYNLSRERYRVAITSHSAFPKYRLGALLNLEFGTRITKKNNQGMLFPVYGGGGESFRTDAFTREDDVVISRFAMSAQCVRVVKEKFHLLDSGFTFSISDDFDDRATKSFVTQILLSMQDQIYSCARGHAQKNIDTQMFNNLQIPLPPLDVQQEITDEIESYQKVIDGARAVIDNYRPQIPIDPEWPRVPLGGICSVGGTITKDVDLGLPYLGADSIESNTGKLLKVETARDQNVRGPVYQFAGERLLYSKIRPYLNKLTVVDLQGYCSSDMYPIAPDCSRIHISFLAMYMLSTSFNERIRHYYDRASIPKINRSQLFAAEIPLPSIGVQEVIVAEIESEQAIVNANRDLIDRFERKIQTAIARVWGDDASRTAEQATQ